MCLCIFCGNFCTTLTGLSSYKSQNDQQSLKHLLSSPCEVCCPRILCPRILFGKEPWHYCTEYPCCPVCTQSASVGRGGRWHAEVTALLLSTLQNHKPSPGSRILSTTDAGMWKVAHYDLGVSDMTCFTNRLHPLANILVYKSFRSRPKVFIYKMKRYFLWNSCIFVIAIWLIHGFLSFILLPLTVTKITDIEHSGPEAKLFTYIHSFNLVKTPRNTCFIEFIVKMRRLKKG